MYILTLDQSTSATKAGLIDVNGRMVTESSRLHHQYYPKPGWVEHDPMEIFHNTCEVLTAVMERSNVHVGDIAAIGITNQRETVVVWDGNTGMPVYPAIVWQCRRTADICDELERAGVGVEVGKRTGLLLDPYFSASKITWILDNVEGARQRAENGDLMFGTMDAWLVWKLTEGAVHATDVTNASRTMLFNIHSLDWDPDLLKIFSIPHQMLPEIRRLKEGYGSISENSVPSVAGIPIAAVMGDSQAALFGQRCFNVGQIKATYGTGTSILVNTGTKAIDPVEGLVTSVAWQLTEEVEYVQECIIHTTGGTLQWLMDDLHLFSDYREMSDLLNMNSDNEGVYLVPAFVGLGAPYWESQARAAIWGMSRGTQRGHIIRAALEAVAYQVTDALDLMLKQLGTSISTLHVDGGLTQSDFLMQFQADMLQVNVRRSRQTAISSVGVGYMAGLSIGVWRNIDEIVHVPWAYDEFHPIMSKQQASELREGWNDAVSATLFKTQRYKIKN